MVSPMGNSACSRPIRNSVRPSSTATNPDRMRPRFGIRRLSTATWNTTRIAAMGATSTTVPSALSTKSAMNSMALVL